jgi:glutamine amidotransferase PdxT
MELLNEDKITVDQIDIEQLESLSYNILPGGETFLHKLAKKPDIIEKILEKAHP